MKSSSKMTTKSALELAEKKAEREQREICVHKEVREDLDTDVLYITPKEKIGKNVEHFRHVETFEPEGGGDGEGYTRLPISDYEALEEGTRVVVNGENVHTITEVTSRQIVTNFGDKFRRSDGVEWGGGDKEITTKVEKS